NAFRAAFGADYAALEKQLEAQVREGEFKYRRIEFDKLQFDARVSEEAASRAEVLYALGALLALSGPWNAPSARAHLEEVLEHNSTNARAHALLGVVLETQGHKVDAEEHFNRAIDLGLNDHLPYLLFGTTKMQQAMATLSKTSSIP